MIAKAILTNEVVSGMFPLDVTLLASVLSVGKSSYQVGDTPHKGFISQLEEKGCVKFLRLK